MSFQVSSLLPWILPPVVGAAIGYITNAIAIRMLFRPLAAKYVFKIRIPFTPGIIPRQRGNLAENIARMVSNELLTEDALKRQIQSPRFREGIQGNIVSFTEKFLNMEVGSSFLPDKPANFDGNPMVQFDTKGLISSFLSDFFQSSTFQQIMETVIIRVVHLLYESDLKKILSRIDENHLDTILSFLTSEKMEEQFQTGLERMYNNSRQSGKKLSTLLTSDVVNFVCTQLDSLYPYLFSSFMNWMKEDSTRLQLETRGRGLVRDVQEKLNALQRFFISAAQYDRVLDDKMPEIVWDLIKTMEEAGSDSENQKKLVDVVKKVLTSYGEKTFDQLPGLDLKNMVHALFQFLSRGDIKNKLVLFIRGKIDSMEPVTIGRFLDRLTGMDEERVIEFLSSNSLQWFRNRGGNFGTVLIDFVISLFRDLEPKSLKEFLGLSGDSKQSLDAFITQRVVVILDDKIPEILDSFDVRQLVIDKINGLDMESVEKLLLMVIQKHLRWINIFGGILGAIIGMVQVLVNSVL